MGNIDNMAGIEYVGQPGVTQACFDAIVRLIQSRETVNSARLLSSGNEHCFILSVGVGDLVAVKSGFSSGYMGEGPRGLSRALCLLDYHDVDVEEYIVDESVLRRVDASCLTRGDLVKLERAQPVWPPRWHGYVEEYDWSSQDGGRLWHHWCEPVLPYAIIDFRILDLARRFWDDPDGRLLDGYRRLEDAVRAKAGLQEHGQKLFSSAFLGDTPKLTWNGINSSEQQGRAQLFIGTTMTYRNPRAHRELDHSVHEALTEFLLLNHLFLLEGQALPTADMALSHA